MDIDASETQKGQKIFFASRRFVTGDEGVQSAFSEGDFLYGRVLLAKPVSKYAANGVITLEVFYRADEDDTENTHYIKIEVPEKDMNKTSLDFDLLPEKPHTVFADFASGPALMEMVMNQADAEMPVHFRISLGDLEGGFSYTKRSDESFYQWANNVRANSVSLTKDHEAANTFLPDVFDRESEAFEDPVMSKEFILDYLLKKVVEVKKLVIGPGPDYVIERNILGEILALRTKRYIMVVYKADDGYCYFGNCTFYRAHLGGGRYGNPEMTTVSIDTRIDCANI